MEWYPTLWPWMHIVGRILFFAIFITSGISHLTKTQMMAGYAQSRGAPAPTASVVLSGIMILVGGVLVLLGWHRFIGAGLIFVPVVMFAVVIHPYWREKDPMARAGEKAHFMKDLALAGAALLIACNSGAYWPMSLGG